MNSKLFTNRFLLNVTFKNVFLLLLGGTTLFSCRKDGDVGLSLIGDDLTTQLVDTFPLNFSIQREDTLQIRNTGRHLLGVLNDPQFGRTSAQFCTQLIPSTALTPNFSNLKIDSALLSFPFLGYFGDTNSVIQVTVKVLGKRIYSDSVYSQFSDFSTQINRVGGGTFRNIQPSVSKQYREPTGSGGDTLVTRNAMLRIPIDTNLAKSLLLSNKTSSSADFLNYFNGFSVEAKLISGNGLVMYLAPALSLSGLNIYYHDAGSFKRYDFNVNSSCAWKNTFDYQYGNSEAQRAMISGQVVQDKLFVEGMAGFKTKVTISNLRSILTNKDIVIQKAFFEFPVHSSQTKITNQITPRIGMVAVDSNGKSSPVPDQFFDYFGGQFNSIKNTYEVNLTQYFQKLVYQSNDYGFYILSSNGIQDGTRVVLNSNKAFVSPKLTIIYTKIP
jgi:hypothetical protein